MPGWDVQGPLTGIFAGPLFLCLPVTTSGKAGGVLRHTRSCCLCSVEKRRCLGALLLMRASV